MFIRKKKNKSGTVSVQIISKKFGRYIVQETLGSSYDLNEIQKLYLQAEHRLLKDQNIEAPLFPTISTPDATVENFVSSLVGSQVRTVGPELIFGKVFDDIGYNKIQEKMFRHLVIARLVYPVSKLKTVDYLERYQNVITNEDAIYRFLDKLHTSYKTEVEQISYGHTKKILGEITVAFYDMTTLYFDIEEEDDLRKIGFSKDGKFQCPQIMIGLLVGEDGYPIGYDVFEGNTFEGGTLVPILKKIQEKYGFAKPTVVADSAMLSKETIKSLIDNDYTFILGGRIKNENRDLTKKILDKSKGMKNGETFEIQKDTTRLIISFSDSRAKKDAHNRKKGLDKLREKVGAGNLTKASITNRGYNKFLTLSGGVKVSVSEEKITADTLWDGLKGYVTTSTLPIADIIKNYSHLWKIEKAFRISKTDLRIRPIHHYKRKRIESHLCICFVAYSIWKEVERLLYEAKFRISTKRASELVQTIYEIEYQLPDSKLYKKKLLALSSEQQLLYDAIYLKT